MRLQTGQPDTENKLAQRATTEADSTSALSLGDVVQMLGRHKWFIVACVALSTAVSAIYVATATPIYEAAASIRIDPSRAGSLGLNDLLSGNGEGSSADMIATEIAIIKSDAVAIATLDSLSNDQFRKYAGAEKKQLGISEEAASLSPAQEALLGRFKSQLSVSQVQGTQLVGINFRDPNAQTSAVIVNQLIAAYLRQSFDSRYGSVTQVTKWLSAEMDSLKERAAEAQKKLADFQEKNNILGTDTTGGSGAAAGAVSSDNTTMDRLRLLNDRLTQAQTDRIVKEAQMRSAMTDNPAVLASLFPSANLTSLQSEQSRLYAQYAQLSTKFGPSYPPLIDLKAQMQKIDAELEREVSTVKGRMKQEYDAATATESMLQREYDDQTEKAYALNRQQAEYAVLKAEGSSSRELYNTLQIKLQQAGVDAGLNAVNTMLVDRARTPLTPIEPKKLVIMSFGLVLGLFAGIGAAFLKEATSDKVQGVDQLERVLGFPLLAAIPHVPLKTAGSPNSNPGATAPLVAFSSPLSRGAESYRTLRNAILLSSLDKPAKTVLVTSTIPGEGKSSTAANYAIVLAQKGARVLIVDADVRRPTLHMKFGVTNRAGLSDLLTGENDHELFLNPFPELENLVLLPAGKSIAFPSEALGSNKLYSLIGKWEKEFDYVIIDSAPLLIVSDSFPLARWADALILVTRYNLTPTGALKRIRDVLQRIDARVAGVILNDITDAGAGYGEYGNDYYQ